MTPQLPNPGKGHTSARWQALSKLGAESLPLAKVLEAHYDALSIFSEAGQPLPSNDAVWAVWAAGGPHDTATYEPDSCTVSGLKPWCSAALDVVTHALVTVSSGDQTPLAIVTLTQDHFTLDASQWHGPGMAGIPTGSGHFMRAPAVLLGKPTFYLERPGFWHGGAGIAACWYGAATAIAEQVRRSPRVAHNPFSAAHLGAIDEQLTGARLMLHHLADAIDNAPAESHQLAVIRLRSMMDRVCRDVLERAALALGPVSLCCDAEHAQRCADLAAFIRQSHGEKDEQWLGEQLHVSEVNPWVL
ncbi:dehydrogenase [Xanthomonas vesicatoria ATCC 35937]|uniref:Uncharacterized protein n=2 Tax=Xanthomonas vesicatoria TaxID=56460 RepID=F0BKC6_9XANT|nr:dehydrogenase [Xanthomonas vesicatoria ATCC 35937]EGD07056.1 hypothetical protein XVE_4740 [Xanthomonas vesicatoria ATCC 35937]